MTSVLTRKLSATAALLMCAGAAHASFKPQPCGNDPHIQCAVYDPNEVYEVDTVKGQATLILFEPGEKIVDNGAAAGDGDAWKVQPNVQGILIKQHLPNPDSNFLVVTNYRHYTFSLVNTNNPKTATWVLSFNYPDTRAKNEAAEEKKDDELRDAIKDANAAPQVNSTRKNTNFMMHGDTELAPTSLWDDGRFTYFEYATARDLPAGIYVKLPDGTEAVPNQHMDRDTIVIHQTSKEFIVRSGKSVLGIRNDGYSKEGSYNAAGTTVPGTVRIYKENSDAH
jgi:type IV secretion system protein VirB9